jgi:pyridoxal phosphate enzyme (YggS family)
VVDLIHGLDPARVSANLEQIRGEIASAGRDPASVEILAAVKYVPVEEMPALAQGGVILVGENRAQDLVDKVEAESGSSFTWDFIGRLQSRKIKTIAPLVRYIHSVDSESVLAQLERYARPGLEILIEVNVAEEEGKGGIVPADLPSYLDRSPVPVAGLMTMPPLSGEGEDSRPYFAALRELAARHGLEQLSMGTSQDYLVAVQEGATIVRIGTNLYR